jgi:hypothetical protein
MLNTIIPNNTPYLGKMRLKFEKHPYYSGGDAGKFNSVILNLGFTKLVSRLIPTKTLNGWQVDPEKIKLINKYTDGIIADYKHDSDHDEFLLANSFVTIDGVYIGDINEGWRYFKNGLTVCPEYPRGVALKWKTSRFDSSVASGTDGLLGYYGYTHRGGAVFSIGDRVFDPEYAPKAEDYDKEEWAQWQEKFDKLLNEADEFDRKWLEEDGIGSVIPFTKRGERQIMKWDHAREAAIKLSNYLS